MGTDVGSSRAAFTYQGLGEVLDLVTSDFKVNHVFAPIQGLVSDESFTGGARADFILAGGGKDTVHGKGGIDLLYGEDGADKLFGDNGNDSLDGQTENDHLIPILKMSDRPL